MSYPDSSLLHAIPEPALTAHDGHVGEFNTAAVELFDGLAKGGPLPDGLLCQPPAAAMLFAGGRCWHMTASPLASDVLYLLHSAQPEAISQAQLDGVLRCLRQQLAQMMLSAQLLGRDLTADSASRDRLGSMNRSLCQMLRLTEQLDLLRSMEANTFSFLPVTLDLAGLCREVCAAAQGLLDEVNLHLNFDSACSCLLVDGDSALLEKLLLALITNAARAAGADSTLTLSLAKRGQRAVLTLTGNGERDDGRPLSLLLAGDVSADRIPQPGEGAGLGLALVRQIISLHQGTLLMERQDGVRVTVAMPLAPSNAPLSVRTVCADYAGGFSPALVELSDLLPDSVFAHLDVE